MVGLEPLKSSARGPSISCHDVRISIGYQNHISTGKFLLFFLLTEYGTTLSNSPRTRAPPYTVKSTNGMRTTHFTTFLSGFWGYIFSRHCWNSGRLSATLGNYPYGLKIEKVPNHHRSSLLGSLGHRSHHSLNAIPKEILGWYGTNSARHRRGHNRCTVAAILPSGLRVGDNRDSETASLLASLSNHHSDDDSRSAAMKNAPLYALTLTSVKYYNTVSDRTKIIITVRRASSVQCYT